MSKKILSVVLAALMCLSTVAVWPVSIELLPLKAWSSSFLKDSFGRPSPVAQQMGAPDGLLYACRKSGPIWEEPYEEVSGMWHGVP